MKSILSPSIRIGVVQNPFSTMNRKRYGVEHAAAEDTNIVVEQAQETTDIAQILQSFRKNNVGIVVIDGGDGTVREVLSQCPNVFGSDLPFFCILPSGKTNVCAHDIGTAKYKREAFNRLLAVRKNGITQDHIRRRAVLGIRWEDGFYPPVQGMLIGFGGFREATNLAQSHVHSKGFNHNLAVVVTIFSFFYDAVFGSDNSSVRAGDEMAVRFDDDEVKVNQRFGLILTTLKSFVLGVWPFWGEASRKIKWLDVDAPPPHLLRAAIAVLTRRPKPWLQKAGYRSGSANSIFIETHKPFIIDGETFEPGPNGRLRIDSKLHVDFISP